MIERRHLRIVRAVQRVVAAAKELTEAERTLQRPRQHVRPKAAERQTQTGASVVDHVANLPSGRPPEGGEVRLSGSGNHD